MQMVVVIIFADDFKYIVMTNYISIFQKIINYFENEMTTSTVDPLKIILYLQK